MGAGEKREGRREEGTNLQVAAVHRRKAEGAAQRWTEDGAAAVDGVMRDLFSGAASAQHQGWLAGVHLRFGGCVAPRQVGESAIPACIAAVATNPRSSDRDHGDVVLDAH